jgi:hypothetical protein
MEAATTMKINNLETFNGGGKNTTSVREDLKNISEKYMKKLFNYLFFIYIHFNVFKALKMFLYRVLHVFKSGIFLYIYYIVINNIIYNNKNEDCIGESDTFSKVSIESVTFSWEICKGLVELQ